MASEFYADDLTCAICVSIFSDPVTLIPCGHSFCRECVTAFLNLKQQCPQCMTAAETDVKCLPTSRILKNLAEKAKEAEKRKKEHGNEKAELAELCPEHDEKLKLFCVTDQQLTCIICRDGEKHDGHMFKPIKEAAASLRQELEKGMAKLPEDILATEKLAIAQREEMKKNEEKSQQLKVQIHRQFEEMHQFLRKREDEIQNELKYKESDAVEKMSKTLNAIETALSASRQLQEQVTSVLEITETDRLLKRWTECNTMMSPELLFRPKADDFQVVKSSLSLEPYESHLQFFMWKELLQVVQPRAERLSLKSHSRDVSVSEDGRSLFCTPKTKQSFSGFGTSAPTYSNTASSFSFGFGSNSTSHSPSASASIFGAAAPTYSNRRFPSRSNSTFHSSSASTSGFGPLFGTQTYQNQSFSSSSDTNSAFSISAFSSGQHYWEIDVGTNNYWELGIKDNFLKYDGQKYSTYKPVITTELTIKSRPQKIGIYLNCSSKRLSFYDADNMTHIHSMTNNHMTMPQSAYFNVSNRLTVCWY